MIQTLAILISFTILFSAGFILGACWATCDPGDDDPGGPAPTPPRHPSKDRPIDDTRPAPETRPAARKPISLVYDGQPCVHYRIVSIPRHLLN